MDKLIALPMLDQQSRTEAQTGCCLTPGELAVRTAEWNELSSMGLVEVLEESEVLVLKYRRDPELEGVLRHLVDEERQCCSGLDFRISADPELLKLEISGPWGQTPWAAAKPAAEPGSATGEIREAVRRRYAALAGALGAAVLSNGGCCGAGSNTDCGCEPDRNNLKAPGELQRGPSLGCGNVLGAAELAEGETVLDLGSGAGLEVLHAAKQVGPGGKAIGLDMTEEMLAAARANAEASDVKNAEFLKGYVEEIPLPDAAVDIVISNCVINLSASKETVFAEMFRVLKPGGRFALFDVVADRKLDPAERGDLDAWSSCLAGALTREEYRSGLEGAGFRNVSLVESHEVQPGFSSVLLRGNSPGRGPKG